jgi:hypothetical protein
MLCYAVLLKRLSVLFDTPDIIDFRTFILREPFCYTFKRQYYLLKFVVHFTLLTTAAFPT